MLDGHEDGAKTDPNLKNMVLEQRRLKSFPKVTALFKETFRELTNSIDKPQQLLYVLSLIR